MAVKTFEQAKKDVAEYFGFEAGVSIEVDGKVFEIPNPLLLDDDQQERWNDLQFELESCDTVEGEDGKPQALIPYRVDGVLMKPPVNVRFAMALFGEDGYAEYRAAGGKAARIPIEWQRMRDEFAESDDVQQ